MVQLIKSLLLMIILFSVATFVNAVPLVEINVKPSFQDGDTIRFSYTILSQQNENIQYVARVSCPGSSEALLDLKSIPLVRNELFIGEYVYGVVNEDIKGANCLASVSIVEPYNIEFKKSFEVNTLPALSIALSVCKTDICTVNTKVFKQSERIYLDYTSRDEAILVKGILTFPDSSKVQINLPTSINPGDVGTYDLEIIAQKKGYRDINVKEQFAVIEGDLSVTEGFFGNISKRSTLVLVLWIIGGVLLLIVAVGIFFYIRKRKSISV